MTTTYLPTCQTCGDTEPTLAALLVHAQRNHTGLPEAEENDDFDPITYRDEMIREHEDWFRGDR